MNLAYQLLSDLLILDLFLLLSLCDEYLLMLLRPPLRLSEDYTLDLLQAYLISFMDEVDFSYF